jgi:hypothetical protein
MPRNDSVLLHLNDFKARGEEYMIVAKSDRAKFESGMLDNAHEKIVWMDLTP